MIRKPAKHPKIVFALTAVMLNVLVVACDKSSMSESERLLDGFAASSDLIVFSTPISNDNKLAGLIVISRSTQSAKVIEFPAGILDNPSFSPNGERLLFVHKTPHSADDLTSVDSELITCNVHNWNCRTLLRTDHSIVSPVECLDGRIMYGSGKLVRPRKIYRWTDNDLWTLDNDGPRRLSHFGFVNLDSISCIPHGVVLSATGQTSQPAVIAPLFDETELKSDIYQFALDPTADAVMIPEARLSPLYLTGAMSIRPRMSPDGRYAAFLNAPLHLSPYRWDLIIADRQGDSMRRIEANTRGFSRPAFAGNQVLANQVFPTKYETTIVDLPTGHVSTATFLADTDDVAKLPRIALTMASQTH